MESLWKTIKSWSSTNLIWIEQLFSASFWYYLNYCTRLHNILHWKIWLDVSLLYRTVRQFPRYNILNRVFKLKVELLLYLQAKSRNLLVMKLKFYQLNCNSNNLLKVWIFNEWGLSERRQCRILLVFVA